MFSYSGGYNTIYNKNLSIIQYFKKQTSVITFSWPSKCTGSILNATNDNDLKRSYLDIEKFGRLSADQ